jgi:hypothetical protein
MAVFSCYRFYSRLFLYWWKSHSVAPPASNELITITSTGQSTDELSAKNTASATTEKITTPIVNLILFSFPAIIRVAKKIGENKQENGQAV